MSEKSTFHETKEITTRLREPLKIKAVPYRGKEPGHMIEVSMNLSWDQIDLMTDKESDIVAMIKNMIELIEGPMKSKYLGMIADATN